MIANEIQKSNKLIIYVYIALLNAEGILKVISIYIFKTGFSNSKNQMNGEATEWLSSKNTYFDGMVLYKK